MNFTYERILQIALAQSAIDLSCEPEDFGSGSNKVVISQPDPAARKYLELPFFCQIASYGNNAVASVSEAFAPFAEQYIGKHGEVHCFETPALLELDRELRKYGQTVCFMARYYLPVPELVQPRQCGLELRVMQKPDFEPYYLPAFSNAICAGHSERDVLAVGAFDGDRLAGLAGASADCDSMWQIGVDVLPDYRRQGIAPALTSRLALEILERGKVPFYCAAWSNIKSVRSAIRSGFRPAWAEMTAKPAAFVDEMNTGKEA